MTLIAALPMYDWPERRAEVDAEWVAIRDALRRQGVEAPEKLSRDIEEGMALWRRPDLLFSQTCWGPMELGLAEHVQVVGQPSYNGIEGGEGELYSSAIVMRASAEIELSNVPPPLTPPLKGEGDSETMATPSPLREGVRGGGADAQLPLSLLRNARFAFNSPESMSGIIGLTRDLETLGESLDIFASRIETGGHRNSVKAVAEGRADVATIDCRSWQLAQLYEPAAQNLQVVGWTAKREGLPFITAKGTSPEILAILNSVINLAT